MTEVNKSLHVVLAADAKFAMPLSVAMCSIAVNCDRLRDITFYVLQHDIGPEIRERVEKPLMRRNSAGTRVLWLDVPFQKLSEFKTHGHLGPMTYARLVIPWVLPQEVERVLYLDSDLVVVGNVAELWDRSFYNQTLVAARDRIVGSMNGPLGLRNYRQLGIPENAEYFNAGVLLIDLRKWRTDGVSERVIEYLHKNRAIIQMVDQEALNAVLFDSWAPLECRWNWQVGQLKSSRSQRKGADGVQQKSIIHFTTAAKPWLPGCRYEEREVFFEYLDQTEWAGWRIPVSSELRATCLAGIRGAAQLMRRLGRRAWKNVIPLLPELQGGRTSK
jgi:lipopolysaccharide biosynthesis glycosyltransferase